MEKIAKEMAQAEFDRFASAMDLDIDVESMNEEDKKSFDQQVEKIIAAIQKGHLVVNDKGEPEYTLQRGEEKRTLIFHEPTGASLMAMDTKKKTEDVSKMFATMADITKSSPKWFAQMKMADLKVCMAVTTLFLG